MPLDQKVFYDLSQLIAWLPTNIQRGIHPDLVADLRERYGANVIHASKHSWIVLLLRQFNSGFCYLLLGVVGIYFLLGEWGNGVIMLAIVSLMAFFGFYEEFYADRTLQDLSRHFRLHVRVIRGGRITTIDAEQLVVGDLVLVDPGDVVCADVWITQAESLLVDESIMTGESLPISKEVRTATLRGEAANSTLYTGSKVVAGKGAGIVVATGVQTAFGKLIGVVPKFSRLSNFSQGLNKFSLFVLWFVSATIGTIFLVHLLWHGTSIDIFRLLIFYISLAVAVVPQALQAVINFSLARAAAKLAQCKVLVKRFAALEDLASVEVLCVDKTGTLTENHLSVAQVYAVAPWPEDDVLIAGYQGIAAHKKNYIEPFDRALLENVQSRGLSVGHPGVLKQIPFDPVHKQNVTFVSWQNHVRVVVRGAFEAVAVQCSQAQLQTDAFKEWINEQESLGCRVLTIAIGSVAGVEFGDYGTTLALVGAIAFRDEVKKSARGALAEAKAMHVGVKMLTGDSAVVARHVAQELEIFAGVDELLTGALYDELSEEEKDAAVVRCNVFARVSPLQKYEIVTRLQKLSDVGFLGDGINDIPSIKAAAVGFAVQNAGDATKDAADIVLLTKSINVIIEGMRQGRAVFINSVKYLRLTLSSNFSNFYTLAIISLINGNLPMLPVQLLAVNLLSDLPMLFIATDRVEPYELEYPTSANVNGLIVVTAIFGIVCTVFDFLFLGCLFGVAPATLQTNWFVFSLWTELALFFSIRTKQILGSGSWPSFPMLVALIFVGGIGTVLPFTLLGQKWLHLQPLQVRDCGYMVVILGLNIVAIEVVKRLWYRKYRGDINKR